MIILSDLVVVLRVIVKVVITEYRSPQGCIFFPKIEFFINHYLEALSFLWSEMAISGQIWSFLSKKSEFFFIKWTQFFFIKSAKNGSFL